MTLIFRRGTMDDCRAMFDIFTHAIAGLERRQGVADSDNSWLNPSFIAGLWERSRPLFEHLTRTADQVWIAENEQRPIGYARATLHDGIRELTDFFVLPDHQAGGVGRDLLARSFTASGERRRVIVATSDIRALSRYLKAGVYPRFPIYHISAKPRPVEVASDLTFIPATDTPETIAAIRLIDSALLGFVRDADHEFLLRDRTAYLYRRGDQVVGYGYFGKETGPIALLDEADFPAVLAHAETEAAANNAETFEMELPLINRAAVDYLLGRGFRLDDFAVFFMSDEPFGAFERYIFTSPPFFI